MLSHTRAIIAAAAYAVTTGQKVGGVYDHAAGRHLRIAAECRGERVQVRDGERGVDVDGTLPDLYDYGDRAFVSFDRDGASVRGYDRGSAGFYEANVGDRIVQLYDHGEGQWFAFGVQIVSG